MQASFFNEINPCGFVKYAIAYEVADAMKFAVANEGFISLYKNNRGIFWVPRYFFALFRRKL